MLAHASIPTMDLIRLEFFDVYIKLSDKLDFILDLLLQRNDARLNKQELPVLNLTKSNQA